MKSEYKMCSEKITHSMTRYCWPYLTFPNNTHQQHDVFIKHTWNSAYCLKASLLLYAQNSNGQMQK